MSQAPLTLPGGKLPQLSSNSMSETLIMRLEVRVQGQRGDLTQDQKWAVLALQSSLHRAIPQTAQGSQAVQGALLYWRAEYGVPSHTALAGT